MTISEVTNGKNIGFDTGWHMCFYCDKCKSVQKHENDDVCNQCGLIGVAKRRVREFRHSVSERRGFMRFLWCRRIDEMWALNVDDEVEMISKIDHGWICSYD